jgi:hypothetical protein
MRGIKVITSILFLIFAIAAESHASAQCVECHEEMTTDHSASVHKDIQCLECHAQAAEEDHEQLVFVKVDCRQCHGLHDEKSIHDAHSRVDCNACHIKGGIPAIDPESKRIVFGGMFRPAMALPPHQAIQSKTDDPCVNCHFQGNTLGASSMVLPPKSILCMPCHVATFSVNDKTTLVSLCIFLLGMAGLGMVWFSGSRNKRTPWTSNKTESNPRCKPDALSPSTLFRVVKMIFIEVFLLKRLFQQSKARWIIHSLIFFPFLFRFAFGLTALLCSLFLPDGSVSAVMLDKNDTFRALFFDITGLMILTGSLFAFVRKKKNSGGIIATLPEPGRGMSAMIGLIVVVGFIIEGLRIAMTGWPGGTGWAFLGYGISLLFKDMTGLTDIYGIFWHVHAILTGIFIALIPFTRMSHIITAPIVLIMNARSCEQGYCQK